MIRSVVVTGDCLRPNPDGTLGSINIPTKWLHRLLDRQLGRATGLPVRPLLLDAIAGINALGFYRKIGTTDRLAGWTELYDGSRYFADVVQLYEPFLRDALVVGFELPAYLRRVLGVLRVPFVDLWVHPVRFLDDLIFGLNASDDAIRERIAAYAMSEDEVWMTAGLRRATAVTGPPCYLEPDTTLVLGQSQTDKSQVRHGRFVDARDFDRELWALAARPGPWLVKPHPAEPHHTLTTRVRELVPHARTVTDNVYHLFAQDEIVRVISLNSSSTVEARYFGKAVTTFLPPVIEVAYRGDRVTNASYYSVGHQFLDPDFWRSVLAPALPTTPADGFRHAAKANRVRVSLRAFWGFQQIDSDIFVNLSRPAEFETARVRSPDRVGQGVNVLPAMAAVIPGNAVKEDQRFFLPRCAGGRLEVCGPWLPAAAGRYRLTVAYRLVSPPAGPDPPLGVDVCYNAGQGVIVPPQGCVSDRVPAGEYRSVLEFDVPEAVENLETRLWSGSADVLVTAVTLERLAERPGHGVSVQPFSLTSMPVCPACWSYTAFISSIESK